VALAAVGLGLYVGPGAAIMRMGDASPRGLATGQWHCSLGTYFQVVGAKFQLGNTINHWQTLGRTTGDKLNALAYVPSSHNMIAIDAQSGPNLGKLVSINPIGNRTIIGAVSGLSRATTWLGGDVDPSTGLYYVSHGGHQLTAINLATLTAHVATLPPSFSIGFDLVVQKDWLWTVNAATIDGFSLVSGATKSFAIPAADHGSNAGTLWSTSGLDELFFRWNNNGATYKVTGLRAEALSITKVASLGASATTSQDGTTCVAATPGQPDTMPALMVSGNLPGPLNPGETEYVNLTVTNSYSSPVTLPAHLLRVYLSGGTTQCPLVTNFIVKHGITADITIPASTTTTLSAIGIPKIVWPAVQMLETHTNQDACQGIPLAVSYQWLYRG
jgi:hypothetical protein